MSKTYAHLHEMTDKHFGLQKTRSPLKLRSVDGVKWHEVFDYLNWKYNTTKKQKMTQWDENRKILGL